MGYRLVWGGLYWCSPQALVRVCVDAVLLRAWAFGGSMAPWTAHWATSSPGRVLSPSSGGGEGGGPDRLSSLLTLVALLAVATSLRLLASTW